MPVGFLDRRARLNERVSIGAFQRRRARRREAVKIVNRARDQLRLTGKPGSG
jgi:hypothetical protein